MFKNLPPLNFISGIASLAFFCQTKGSQKKPVPSSILGKPKSSTWKAFYYCLQFLTRDNFSGYVRCASRDSQSDQCPINPLFTVLTV